MDNKRMIVITITNQKGGVAKTTTAAALGFGLAMKGYKVLFVDADAQANLTETVYPVDENGQIITDFGALNLNMVMLRKCSLKDTIRHSKYENVDLVPADLFLSEIDTKLMMVMRREYVIREALQTVADEYDFCVIDTPPSLSWMTLNSLIASDAVIIPTYMERFSLKGINQLYENFLTIKNTVNQEIKLLGFLLTRNKRNSLSKQLKELLETQIAVNMKTSIFKTTIREQVAVNEAQMLNMNIYDYMKSARKTRTGNVAEDYMNFTEEVLERLGK